MEERIISTLQRAVALGILPDTELKPQQIRARIRAYQNQQEEQPTLLREQDKILRFLNYLEEKGLMDVFYPDGYKIKKLRPRRSKSNKKK